jgi:hypothetical protein
VAFTSFDQETAGSQTGPGVDLVSTGFVPVELPADQQVTGRLWPIPDDHISDHGTEGAPWLPAARGIPLDPPLGPLWAPNHDGPSVPFSAAVGPGPGARGPQPAVHAGTGRRLAIPQVNLGRPFTRAAGPPGGYVRHLTTTQYDVTGKAVRPADAPSAQVQLYGSEHYTTPRFIGYDVSPLFDNIGSSNQFSANPGYLGVSDNVPNSAARMRGAVAAQPPDDPFVAQQTGQAAPGAAAITYDLEF